MLLMEIYGSFEGRPADGVRIGEQLARAYPDNPEVQFELAELYLGPAVEDYAGAAAQYEKVIASESRRRRAAAGALSRAARSRVVAASQQWRVDEGIRVLSATIDRNPATPAWVMPAFLLRRANYRALLGDAAAADDVNRVLAEPTVEGPAQGGRRSPEVDGDRAARAARRRSTRRSSAGTGSRRSGKWDEAAAAYEPVRRDHPNDPQVRYRLARPAVRARRRRRRERRSPAALAADRTAPAWIKAQSLLIVGRAHDLAGPPRRRDADLPPHRGRLRARERRLGRPGGPGHAVPPR